MLDQVEGVTGRSGFKLGALAGVVVCAAAVTVALVLASGDDGPPLAKNWSTWQPETTQMLEGRRRSRRTSAPSTSSTTARG